MYFKMLNTAILALSLVACGQQGEETPKEADQGKDEVEQPKPAPEPEPKPAPEPEPAPNPESAPQPRSKESKAEPSQGDTGDTDNDTTDGTAPDIAQFNLNTLHRRDLPVGKTIVETLKRGEAFAFKIPSKPEHAKVEVGPSAPRGANGYTGKLVKISQHPGDFSFSVEEFKARPGCFATGTRGATIQYSFNDSDSGCKLDPSKTYYLNLRLSEAIHGVDKAQKSSCDPGETCGFHLIHWPQ